MQINKYLLLKSCSRREIKTISRWYLSLDKYNITRLIRDSFFFQMVSTSSVIARTCVGLRTAQTSIHLCWSRVSIVLIGKSLPLWVCLRLCVFLSSSPTLTVLHSLFNTLAPFHVSIGEVYRRSYNFHFDVNLFKQILRTVSFLGC